MYRHKRCVYKSLREFRPDGAVQRKGGEKLRSILLYNKMMSPINQQLRPKKEFPRSQFRGRRSTRCTERIKNKKTKTIVGMEKKMFGKMSPSSSRCLVSAMQLDRKILKDVSEEKRIFSLDGV